MTGVDEQQDREQTLREQMADAIERGTVTPITEQDYNARIAAKGKPNEWPKFRDRQTAAQVIVDQRRAAVAAAKAEAKAAMKAKLAAARQQFVANDRSGFVTEPLLDRMTAAIRELFDNDDLMEWNVDLRKKTGAITHRDIAFIGIVHRQSVTDNGTKDARLAGTSPFKRCAEASTKFGYRDAAFCNRQIRAALTILETLGFTQQIEQAKHSYHRASGEVNTAGKYTISTAPEWASIFS